MFERFTERARQVVVFAQDESRLLGHNHIGTEHLLLGLIREQEGIAARVLRSLGIDADELRAQIVEVVPPGDAPAATGQIPFSPRAKRVLELSLREALALGHNYIGTEHVLLALAREEKGVAGRVLESFGADAEVIRDVVVRALGGAPAAAVQLERRPLRLSEIGEWSEPRDRRRLRVDGGTALATLAFPLGLLVGWLIWG